MYRIVCESLERFKSDFENREDQSRYKCMIPLELITDVNFYKSEKNQESLKYKKLSDFLWRVEEAQDRYPEFSALLWTLESRGMVGRKYDVLNEDDFSEMVKTVRMFFKLSYWS